jgi:peptidoglycan hydrolase-like protein with peptidoglycan-binding domain
MSDDARPDDERIIDRDKAAPLLRDEGTDLPDGGLGLTSPLTKGTLVRKLQDRLRVAGYLTGAVRTGEYDEATAEAVRRAKADLGIEYDEDTADRAPPELLRLFDL